MEQGGDVPWFEIPQKRSMCVSAAASLWVWDGQKCWNSWPLEMDQSLGWAEMLEFPSPEYGAGFGMGRDAGISGLWMDQGLGWTGMPEFLACGWIGQAGVATTASGP